MVKKLILILAFVLIVSISHAADLIIKDVPAGAEDKVKKSAMITIERYLRAQKETKISGMGDAHIFADQAEIDAYKKSIDDIRVANGLPKKFSEKDWSD